MSDPYTIQIHVLSGNPNGVRIINRPADWPGVAIVFPREQIQQAIQTELMDKAGVYLLWSQEGDPPQIYVGQSEVVSDRLKDHHSNKDFWHKAIVFVSENSLLNAAHVRWLEHSLVQRLHEIGGSLIKNKTEPKETKLSIQDMATCKVFLNRILEILPLTGLGAFENSQKNETLSIDEKNSGSLAFEEPDTIIVPTGKTGEGFEEVFLGQDCWYYVKLSQKKIEQLKFIAAYRPSPVSAVTHVAKIKSIELFGDNGKYKVTFAAKAEQIKPIPFGSAKSGAMQGPRFTTKTALSGSEDLGDIL